MLSPTKYVWTSRGARQRLDPCCPGTGFFYFEAWERKFYGDVATSKKVLLPTGLGPNPFASTSGNGMPTDFDRRMGPEAADITQIVWQVPEGLPDLEPSPTGGPEQSRVAPIPEEGTNVYRSS